MPEMTLKIKKEDLDLDIEVGKLTWSLGPGYVHFEIPMTQKVGETESVDMVGYLYYDFSEFLILLDFNSETGGVQFLVDTRKIQKVDREVFYLPEVSEGMDTLLKLAAEYTNEECIYRDEWDTTKLVENMLKDTNYIVFADPTPDYDRCVFSKNNNTISVKRVSRNKKDERTWKFNLDIIDILIDDHIDIRGFSDIHKIALKAKPLETATIKDLNDIESILYSFLSQYEELPKVFNRLVKM